jgi:repressor LexA
MEPLTERQQQILDFVAHYSDGNGRPPSVREIARHFRIASPKAITDHLGALERKGHLRRRAGIARGIDLTQKQGGIPIVGRVAAGLPITAVENVEGSLEVGTMFGRGPFFAVRVVGESMRDAGIRDGDFVVVRKDGAVENRQIAVAYIDGDATVKRFHKHKNGYRLDPENPLFDPIYVDHTTSEFRLAGPVVGVIRKVL